MKAHKLWAFGFGHEQGIMSAAVVQEKSSGGWLVPPGHAWSHLGRKWDHQKHQQKQCWSHWSHLVPPFSLRRM